MFEGLGLAIAATKDERGWRLSGYGPAPPNRSKIATCLALAAALCGIAPPEPEFERIAPEDWVRRGRGAALALRVGRILVHDGTAGAKRPPAAIEIALEAGMAFGSGRHETTQGVLLALDRIARRKRRVRRALDLGTGAGILAIAMAKLWRCPVVAADNDPLALVVAADNARANGVAPLIRPLRSEGLAARSLAPKAAFDVIAANILARPIRALAVDLVSALAPGGYAVLSGILATEAATVAQAYARRGLRRVAQIDLGPWRTLILQRSAVSPRGAASDSAAPYRRRSPSR